MITRRNVLSGLAALTTTGCGARQTALAPYQYPIAPPPPDRASQGLDSVIDISRSVTVSDFRRVRQSNILAVIHKASEGGDYADSACAARRPQAEAAGLLWGTYHYGTGQMSGQQQAAFFLAASRPGPKTLLTGRLPVVYVHPTWANGDPLPNSGLSLGARITPDSILARCGLWVADYHDSPELPVAWASRGWRLWQYAADESTGRPAYGSTNVVAGISHCDRNLFAGDEGTLRDFWGAVT
jgi:lysozyme